MIVDCHLQYHVKQWTIIQVIKVILPVAVIAYIQQVHLKKCCIGESENAENIKQTVYITAQRKAVIGRIVPMADSTDNHHLISWAMM